MRYLKAVMYQLSLSNVAYLIAILSLSIFCYPGQIHDIYRELLIAPAFSGLQIAFGCVAIGLLSIALFLSTYVTQAQELERKKDEFNTLFQYVFLLVLPVIVSTLPIIGIIFGVSIALDGINGGNLEPSTETQINNIQSSMNWLIAGASVFIASVCVLGYILRGYLSELGVFSYYAILILSGGILFCVLLVHLLDGVIDVSQSMGSIAVICFFLSFLTSIATFVTLISQRIGFSLISILVIAAVFFSLSDWNDNHYLRLSKQDLSGSDNEKTVSLLNLEKAFVSWLSKRADIESYAKMGRSYPIYVVSAEGGGIYAAYNAATFLARLQDTCPSFASHMFAISSVSGGSIGASVFASLAHTQAHNVKTQKCNDKIVSDGPFELSTRQILANDFLSPLLWYALFPDFLQRLLPFPVESFDRSLALEYSLEAAWDKSSIASQGGSNPLKKTLRQIWSPKAAIPVTLFNTTLVHRGSTELIAPIKVNFFDAVQSGAYLGAKIDVSLSSAAFASARFPGFTPPARFQKTLDGYPIEFQMVDGGYFENSATRISKLLIDRMNHIISDLSLGQRLKSINPELKLIPNFKVVHLSITTRHAPEKFSPLGEVTGPAVALYNARIDRGRKAARSTYLALCSGCDPDFRSSNDLSRTKRLDAESYPLPLGWYLAKGTRDFIDTQLGSEAICSAYRQEKRFPVEIDCHAILLQAELM